MPEFKDPRSLAEHLLRDSVTQLSALSPKVNFYSVRSVGGACMLLGFELLAHECESILQVIPDASFRTGVISNFKLPQKAPPSLRQIATIDHLKSDHPPITSKSVSEYIRRCGESQSHLQLAAEGRYQEAFAACKSELEVEETAASQAVLGDIELALESAKSMVEPKFRADNVRFICTIELYRRERWSSANELFSIVCASQFGPDAAAQLALGANHYLPWLGYPFPDW